MHYADSLQLPYSCRQVFDLVADIERYPEFLPGWTRARILARQDNHLLAEQQLQTGPAVFRFHSTAELPPCSRVYITANAGPVFDSAATAAMSASENRKPVSVRPSTAAIRATMNSIMNAHAMKAPSRRRPRGPAPESPYNRHSFSAMTFDGEP